MQVSPVVTGNEIPSFTVQANLMGIPLPIPSVFKFFQMLSFDDLNFGLDEQLSEAYVL